MLKDIDIRKPLKNELVKINKGYNYRIIDELAVCDGEARADVAVINGKLCGYEIKSDRDNLERLPNQISAYNKTFDFINIVVGEKYQNVILYKVPSWWGIKVAYKEERGTIYIKNIREARLNKNVDTRSVIELLWRDELMRLLKDNGIRGISNKNRRKLRDIAIEAISHDELKKYTRETLKSREDWRVD